MKKDKLKKEGGLTPALAAPSKCPRCGELIKRTKDGRCPQCGAKLLRIK